MEKDKTFHISWWHIAYLCVIFLIIIIALIVCMSRESVSDAAMDNVSFASSIVSIVLAVVSIVVSLYATFSTSANLGSMQDVARGIRRSLHRLRSLKIVADDTNRRVKEIIEKATPEEIRRKRLEEQVEEEIDAKKAGDSETTPVTSDLHEPPVESSRSSENPAAASAAQSPSPETAPGAGTEGARQQPTTSMLTPREMADIENRAITKVGGLLGFSDIMRDYNLRINNISMMFDGVYQSPEGSYTFIEVTSVSRASMAAINMRLSRFRHHILDLLDKMRPGANHIYYVIVFRNNDKQSFIRRIPTSRISLILRDTPNLTFLYLNLDEL